MSHRNTGDKNATENLISIERITYSYNHTVWHACFRRYKRNRMVKHIINLRQICFEKRHISIKNYRIELMIGVCVTSSCWSMLLLSPSNNLANLTASPLEAASLNSLIALNISVLKVVMLISYDLFSSISKLTSR